MRPPAILLFLLFLLSCEPEANYSVEIGSGNDKLLVIHPDPIISISIPGTDSLDLNSDGKYDIRFIKSPKPALTGFASITEIVTSDNLQIALSEKNNYPDTLTLNSILDINSNWSDKISSTLILQSFECNSDNCPGFGNFINVVDKYIGYRIGNNLGWIRVDNLNYGEISIKEYTVIKSP